jgi:hypothetical protein
MRHIRNVDNDVFVAIRDGRRTATIGVYFPFLSQPACNGDTFAIVPYEGDGIVEVRVVDSCRKKLHTLTDEDIAALGYPDMKFRNFDALVYASATDWFKRVWDILNPFQRMKWKDDPMVLIHFVVKES